jgi:predicted RecB family nuclease
MAPGVCLREGGGRESEILGMPDFMILDGDDYLIRDAKTTKKATRDSAQVQLCGWRFEKSCGTRPGAECLVISRKS